MERGHPPKRLAAPLLSALVVAGCATLCVFEGPTAFIGPNDTFAATFVGLAVFGRDPLRTVIPAWGRPGIEATRPGPGRSSA
jgi:hypothetical protein